MRSACYNYNIYNLQGRDYMRQKTCESSWNFPMALKELREDKGYIQEQLAGALHVTKATISHYELGTSTPNIDLMIQMADIFDVSLDYLMGRTTAKIPCDFWKGSFIKGVGNKELIERILELDSKHRKLVFDLLVCIETDHKIKS